MLLHRPHRATRSAYVMLTVVQNAAKCSKIFHRGEFERLLQILFAREPTPLRVLEHYFMVACRKVGDIRRSEELQPSPGGRRRLGDKVWQTCCRVTTRDSEVEQREIYDRTVTAVIYLTLRDLSFGRPGPWRARQRRAPCWSAKGFRRTLSTHCQPLRCVYMRVGHLR